MAQQLTQEMLQRLAEPFRPEQVRWKPQVVTESGKALAVPYVDPRVVTERLDEVVGGSWSFHWEPLGIQGDRLVVKSSLTILGVTREDVGEHVLSDREQADPWKSAVSDALKRAAVHFGVGRYLYWLETVWCTYDRRRREFLDEPYIDAQGNVQVRRRRPESPDPVSAAAQRPEDRSASLRPRRDMRHAPAASARGASPRRIREEPERAAEPAWADEFYVWAGRYLAHQGISEQPQALRRRLADKGLMEAELSSYAALSDAQGAFIRGVAARARDDAE